jgi:hypothetical protein
MSRRYMIWRNSRAYDEGLRCIIDRTRVGAQRLGHASVVVTMSVYAQAASARPLPGSLS